MPKAATEQRLNRGPGSVHGYHTKLQFHTFQEELFVSCSAPTGPAQGWSYPRSEITCWNRDKRLSQAAEHLLDISAAERLPHCV